MLSCKELTDRATEYLEQDLPWAQRLRVRVHLSMCRYCRRYLNQMRKVIKLLKQLPTEAVPPNLVEQLLPEFRQERDKPA